MFELAERLNRLEELIDRQELRSINSDPILIMNGVSWRAPTRASDRNAELMGVSGF